MFETLNPINTNTYGKETDMKNRVISLVLTATLVTQTLTGCATQSRTVTYDGQGNVVGVQVTEGDGQPLSFLQSVISIIGGIVIILVSGQQYRGQNSR